MGVYQLDDFLIKPSEYPWGAELTSPALEFQTGGHGDWFEQESYYHLTSPAWKSGEITHNQQTWLSTSLTGPGTLSFYWAVSSEGGWDKLHYYLDDVHQADISGIVDWTLVEVNIPEGEHIVKWEYTKDGSVDRDQDCGWVSDVSFEEA